MNDLRIKELKNKLDNHIALGLSEDEINDINAELLKALYPDGAKPCKECGEKVTSLVDGLCGACLYNAGESWKI